MTTIAQDVYGLTTEANFKSRVFTGVRSLQIDWGGGGCQLDFLSFDSHTYRSNEVFAARLVEYLSYALSTESVPYRPTYLDRPVLSGCLGSETWPLSKLSYQSFIVFVEQFGLVDVNDRLRKQELNEPGTDIFYEKL